MDDTDAAAAAAVICFTKTLYNNTYVIILHIYVYSFYNNYTHIIRIDVHEIVCRSTRPDRKVNNIVLVRCSDITL